MTGDERLDRLDGSVRGERRHDDVTADFLALVPRSVASNEDRVWYSFGNIFPV
jgi:hypothetical protein